MKRLLSFPSIAIITFTIGLSVVYVLYRSFDYQLSEASNTLETVKPVDVEHQTSKSVTDADILAIYDAILRREGYQNATVFVQESTIQVAPTLRKSSVGGLHVQSFIDSGHVPGASADTIASYKANNTEASSLRGIFANHPNITFWTEKQGREIFCGTGFRGWDRFREKYPTSSGIIRFSNVGFNGVGDEALVYFSDSCGDFYGAGVFVNMQKVVGLWYVASEENVS